MTRDLGAQPNAMMMLGERIYAEQAVAWGLVHEVCADEALVARSEMLAKAVAEGPTLAYRAIKSMLRASETNDFSAQLDAEAVYQQASFSTRDCTEGIAAFVEKRTARFHGE